jgi:multimeric flavodoxin WrbA
MKYLVITGNPKQDGLCHSVTDEIIRGATEGGAEAEILNANGTEVCRCCGDGWGTCRDKQECSFGESGFNKAHEAVRNADMLCLITPVYWWEVAEGLKTLMDKIRRCNRGFNQTGPLSGKEVLLVAIPGASGNGMLPCLEQMERFCRHTGMIVFDYIGVNRWNSDYKKAAAYSAAKAMAEGRKAGTTV